MTADAVADSVTGAPAAGAPTRLRREGGARRPVRIVHLGLGAFHRAHQAWFTARADAEGEWGIAAFTGRGPEAAEVLDEQDGLYTLVERRAEGDRFEVIDVIVETHAASETAALRELVSRPEVTVVTLTVTEKGYRLDPAGALDVADPDVAWDVAALRSAMDGADAVADGVLRTMPGRLLWALLGRRAAGAGPISVVSCDNLAANGAAARAAVHGMAEQVGAGLGATLDVDWIETSVDRITPRTTPADIAAVADRTGRLDLAPVVTEPYAAWVLSGTFRAPRPRWEEAGALVVDDVAPFERRKLWMLNGAHSLLAYAGVTRGHETVAEAIADPVCAAMVDELWDLVARRLSGGPVDLQLDEYRAALVSRFANPSIAHHLRQIAADGSVKLRNRIVEVVAADRAEGGDGAPGLRVIAEWVRFVRAEVQAGSAIDDARADDIARRAEGADAVARLVALISPELAADRLCVATIERMLAEPNR